MSRKRQVTRSSSDEKTESTDTKSIQMGPKYRPFSFGKICTGLTPINRKFSWEEKEQVIVLDSRYQGTNDWIAYVWYEEGLENIF